MNAVHLLETERQLDTAAYAGGCPFHAGRKVAVSLQASDELVMRDHRRVFSQYVVDADGVTQLYLYYGDKEISFDEPELFAFGEKLVRQGRFVAGTATAWGEGYEWPRIRDLLEELLAEGVLQLADASPVAETKRGGARESRLPPAQTHEPRTWLECERITRELTGRPLELGYLELVVPIYRVAHLNLDAEGRQVGEANVFPQALRLDIPTEWRSCPHPGSRYDDEMPMNVTALKSMRLHWTEAMLFLSRVRATYLKRFPEAAECWTVGDIQRLSTLVLAIAGYLTLRQPNPVANGQLHPVLSSAFRVTDGLRMTMHYMLFMPVNEPTWDPEAPVSTAEAYAYAERNNLFLSDYGVCAGPQAMIEEFLRTLVDGAAVRGAEGVRFDPQVEEALNQIDLAFDYALLGLQAHVVVNCLWLAMSRTCERLAELLATWPAEPSDTLSRFRASLKEKNEFLTGSSILGTAELRAIRWRAYQDMFEKSARALGDSVEFADLGRLLRPVFEPQHVQASQQLWSLLDARLNSGADATPLIDQINGLLMDYLREEQAVVRAACAIQARINVLLGRAAPDRPFLATDINLYFQMQDGPRRLPYLVAEELHDILGLDIAVSSRAIEITARPPA